MIKVKNPTNTAMLKEFPSLQGYPGGGNRPPGAPYGGGSVPYGHHPSGPYGGGGTAPPPSGPYGAYGAPGQGGHYGPGPGAPPGGPYGGYGGQPHAGHYGHPGPAGNYRLGVEPGKLLQ